MMLSIVRPRSAPAFATAAALTTLRNTYSTSPASTPFPETFTQTIVLSNGATFTVRSTSPRPQVRLTKDTRNHPLWNPTSWRSALQDESGQLLKFKKRFGVDNELEDLGMLGTDEKVSETLKRAMQGTKDVKSKGKKKK